MTLAKNVLAAAVVMTPNCSANSAEFLISAVRHSTLRELGLDPAPTDSVGSSPNAGTITKYLAGFAATCINQKLRVISKATYLFITCDKGHRSGVNHFAKILSYFNRDAKRAELFTLDIDPAGNTDNKAADAVSHSMKQKEVKKRLSGQCTDNGGGGTLESMKNALEINEVISDKFYFIANCTLHNLSLALSVPVEKVFGLGGRDKNTMLQMHHSVYDLQCHFGQELWNYFIEETIQELQDSGFVEETMQELQMSGKTLKKMPCPTSA